LMSMMKNSLDICYV